MTNKDLLLGNGLNETMSAHGFHTVPAIKRDVSVNPSCLGVVCPNDH